MSITNKPKTESASTAEMIEAVVGVGSDKPRSINQSKKRILGIERPTSMYLNVELWRKVKKAAIDLGITTTEFVEAALKEELKRTENR
jgi:hypothetical protein